MPGEQRSAAWIPSLPKPNSASAHMTRFAFPAVGRTSKSSSPVKRGNPWKATANAPTTRYSTPFEFNNSINSRQSLFSGIGVTAVAEFDQDTQTLLRGHGRVVPRVGLIGVLEAGKYLYRFLHADIIARWVRLPPWLTPGYAQVVICPISRTSRTATATPPAAPPALFVPRAAPDAFAPIRSSR